MDWLKERRNRIADDVDFSEGADMMPMYELTEDLQTKLVLGLESAEYTWLHTKEGGRWFIKTYPQFSLQ